MLVSEKWEGDAGRKNGQERSAAAMQTEDQVRALTLSSESWKVKEKLLKTTVARTRKASSACSRQSMADALFRAHSHTQVGTLRKLCRVREVGHITVLCRGMGMGMWNSSRSSSSRNRRREERREGARGVRVGDCRRVSERRRCWQTARRLPLSLTSSPVGATAQHLKSHKTPTLFSL